MYLELNYRENALKEELEDIPTVANFATVQKEGERGYNRFSNEFPKK